MKRILFTFLFAFVLTLQSNGQSTDSILTKIYQLQSDGNNFYNRGLFPSQRSGGTDKGSREDNNIFFTALIVWTLESSYDSFSDQTKSLADSIIGRARKNYASYKNRNGDITYNFWQTNPDQFFPNSRHYSKRDKYKLPDDLDVTSMIFLTQQGSRAEDSLLKLKMINHTNLFKKKIHSTYRRYRGFKAYNTWFSKDMALEFDVCVMANTLLFVSQKHLTLNEYDSATENVIAEMVRNGDHMKHPYLISPSYQRSPIVLYHLARLVAASPGRLNLLRSDLIAGINECLKKPGNQMEKVILLSSLYRLGQKVDEMVDFAMVEKDLKSFVFFRANLLATNRLWLKKLFGRAGFLNFEYTCEAYNWALLLEFVHLKNLAASAKLK